MDRTDRSAISSPGPRHRLPALVLILAGLCGCQGCASMGLDRGKTLVPTGFQTRTGPFLICTNSRLDPGAPVVRELNALETQLVSTLRLQVDPKEDPIEIYLLDDRQAFDHFLQFHYPNLPRRRAFFLANGKQRVVYTFLGDRTEEDVRHEATHALLHVAVGDMPLWLDEGLAEYFEGTGTGRAPTGGINPEHLDRLPIDLASGWSPDLRRLESLKAVREMSPRDYRESWAWVHYLLNDTRANKAALLAYLGDLRVAPEPEPLSDRLAGISAAPLLAHLDQIRTQPIASATLPLRDPTIRLQSAQVEAPVVAPPTDPHRPGVDPEPSVPVAKRRTILGRIFGWLGS